MNSGYVQLSPTGLVGRTSSDTRSLSELVKGAVIGETQGLLAIHRDDELRPLLLIALPLKPVGTVDALGTGKDAACVVFLSDPDFNADPTADSLRRAFGLTYREAQTAIAIARGNGLKAAAETLGVAQTTARTMLQRTFAKTGTNQQAELAALVLRMLAPLRSG